MMTEYMENARPQETSLASAGKAMRMKSLNSSLLRANM